MADEQSLARCSATRMCRVQQDVHSLARYAVLGDVHHFKYPQGFKTVLIFFLDFIPDSPVFIIICYPNLIQNRWPFLSKKISHWLHLRPLLKRVAWWMMQLATISPFRNGFLAQNGPIIVIITSTSNMSK